MGVVRSVEEVVGRPSLSFIIEGAQAIVPLGQAELTVDIERIAKGKYLLKLAIVKEGEVAAAAEIPCWNIGRLMQPKYLGFRSELRKHLKRMKISQGEFMNFLQSKVTPQLIEKYRELAAKRKEERKRKLAEKMEEYKDLIEKIKRDPVAAILEVVNFYHVGDDVPKHQMVAVIASRFLPPKDRLHAVITGPSSVGKNNLVNAFLKTTPKKWWIIVTRLTTRALDYLTENIGRRYLYIQEYAGAQDARYSVRITLSEGEIIIAYTKRNEKTGEIETVMRKLKGTPVFITTTTAISIDEDMENRTFYINPDTSEEQTKRIINYVIELESNPEMKRKEKEIKKLAKALKLWFMSLKKYDVIIPKEIAEKVAEELPLVVRARRDIKKLLGAIKAHAVLHQHVRKKVTIDDKEYLVASWHDWEYVRKWFLPVLKEQTFGLTEPLKKIVQWIKEHGNKPVTRTDEELRRYLGVSYMQLKRYLERLVELGIMDVDKSKRPYEYRLAKEHEELVKESSNQLENSKNIIMYHDSYMIDVNSPSKPNEGSNETEGERIIMSAPLSTHTLSEIQGLVGHVYEYAYNTWGPKCVPLEEFVPKIKEQFNLSKEDIKEIISLFRQYGLAEFYERSDGGIKVCLKE